MHAITANEATTTTTKSCTTRTEYNQRLISLLKQNAELKTTLQQVKRSGQRYQLKSTVQDIFIKELMETIQELTTLTTKNNNNENENENETKKKKNTDLLLLLTTNYTQRMAELSMDRETINIEKQVQQEQEERRLLTRNCENDDETPTDDDKTNNNRTQSSSMSILLSSVDTNESVMKDIKQQRDSYQTKYETLTKSVTRTTQTLKKKHTEREIRCSLSLRTMRQQMDTMEQERRRWILSQKKHQTVVDARIQSLELENHYLLTQQQQQQQQNDTGRGGIMDDQREEEEEEESKNKYHCHRIQNCLRNTATASRGDRDRDRERVVLVVPSSSPSRCDKPNKHNNTNSISLPSLPLLVSVSSSSGEDTDTDIDNDHDIDIDIDTYSESIASSSSSSSSSVSLDLLFEL